MRKMIGTAGFILMTTSTIAATGLRAKGEAIIDNELQPLLHLCSILGIVIGSILWALGQSEGVKYAGRAMFALVVGVNAKPIIDSLSSGAS